MALSVVWTATAQRERNLILRYYRDRNGNPQFSKELARHFRDGANLLAGHEMIGKLTEYTGIRCLFILDYSLFYSINDEHIVVLSIWDNRRDPEQRPFH